MKRIGRRQFSVLFVGSFAASWLYGCGQANRPTNQKPQVVSTSTILTDLAATIATDSLEIIGILKPGADPHTYEPVPADTAVMEKADLILYNGYNLEPGLIRLAQAAGANVKQIAIGEVITPLQLEKEGQKVPDPHVWGDVKNVAKMSAAIRDALIALAPNDREKMTQNADRLISDLNRLDGWIKQQTQTIPAEKRRLVTTHDAFQYYGRTYGLTIIGTLIGISTEEQPSAQTVQKLVQAIKSAGVPAIFAETTLNPALIQTVAQEAGVKLAPQQLYSDSIGARGSSGETYIKMMVANTTAIVEALGGKVTPFK